jgi:hypothetical protein
MPCPEPRTSRSDDKDNVQAMRVSRDLCRSVPACYGPKVSRSSGALLDTKIGSGYSELTVGVCERVAELLVLGA